LRFRCEDLERYVRDVDVRPGEFTEKEGQGPRRNLLLINKADLLDEGQR
jgi:ribosome biogenesis GTPase A